MNLSDRERIIYSIRGCYLEILELCSSFDVSSAEPDDYAELMSERGRLLSRIEHSQALFLAGKSVGYSDKMQAISAEIDSIISSILDTDRHIESSMSITLREMKKGISELKKNSKVAMCYAKQRS